jgi:hypothetical protein
MANPGKRGDPPQRTYEINVAHQLGPLMRSWFSQFAIATAPTSTVLTGHCSGPDALRELLDLLDTRGHPPVTIHLTSRPEPNDAG